MWEIDKIIVMVCHTGAGWGCVGLGVGCVGLGVLHNYCYDGRCENSLIGDFIVKMNMDCIICIVTNGCDLWV